MELIKRHLFLEECPAELWLVVDIRNFGNRVSLSGCNVVNGSISTSKRAGADI